MKDKICYDPLLFKFPKGVIKKKTIVIFNVQVEDSFCVNNIFLLIN